MCDRLLERRRRLGPRIRSFGGSCRDSSQSVALFGSSAVAYSWIDRAQPWASRAWRRRPRNRSPALRYASPPVDEIEVSDGVGLARRCGSGAAVDRLDQRRVGERAAGAGVDRGAAVAASGAAGARWAAGGAGSAPRELGSAGGGRRPVLSPSWAVRRERRAASPASAGGSTAINTERSSRTRSRASSRFSRRRGGQRPGRAFTATLRSRTMTRSSTFIASRSCPAACRPAR